MSRREKGTHEISRLFRGLATTAAAVSTTLLLVAPAPALAAATTSGCGFTVVPSPNRLTTPNRNTINALSGVTAIAPDDIWAVGYSVSLDAPYKPSPCTGTQRLVHCRQSEQYEWTLQRAQRREPGGYYLQRARPGDPTAMLAFHRADLHRVLRQALPAEWVRTGAEVTAIRQDGDSVTVACGDTELCAEVVIAADGIRSTVRRLLWPDAPPPRFLGRTAWLGVAEMADLPGSITLGPGGYFLIHPIAAAARTGPTSPLPRRPESATTRRKPRCPAGSKPGTNRSLS